MGRAHFAGDLTYTPASEQPAPAIPVDPDVALAQAVAGENSTTAAPQLEGALSVDRLPLSALTGLALGAPQPTKTGALWSDAKFSAGLVNPPSADIALKIGALDVADNLSGHDARVQSEARAGPRQSRRSFDE